MRESCNTGSKGALYVCIFKRKFLGFVVIFIVHIMNCVQHIHVNTGKPFEHSRVLSHYLRIVRSIDYVRSDWRIFRSNLKTFFQTFVFSAVESIEQSFCKVCARSEELHFFSGLCRRYATADRIIVAPNRSHYLIVLILDRRCVYRNL